MDRQRRLAYLRAMDILVWEPRLIPVAAPAPTAEPVDRSVAEAGRSADTAPRQSPVATPVPALPASAPESAAPAVESMDWDTLAAAVAKCRACGLCETRTKTVFGVGHRQAALMCIGEAPGADEDRAGEPFVGRAGQLLDRMLAAIGLRREDVFIANVLKCRPPGNRDPSPGEAASCEPFLARQIALVRPRLILALGRIATQHLLRTDTSLSRLRGRWHALGPNQIPMRATYHPSYLLRRPEDKALAWEDLTVVISRLARSETTAAP